MKRKRNDNTEIKRFYPEKELGLDSAQVQYQIDNNLTNITVDSSQKTYLQIIINNLFTFFNILMVAIALILVIVVGPQTILNLSFLLITFVNILIGTIQECKSKHAIAKLKLLNALKVTVVRDGQEKEISTNDIVLDDVLILKTGDQIPVDCIILDDSIIDANESILTGESRSVKKSLGETLYAGSFVISGYARARADKIGNDTYIHTIEDKIKVVKKPKSKLMISISRIIKTLSSIAIPLAVIVFVNRIISSGVEDFKEAVLYGCLTIPYMVPVGMMLLSSVSMATGVISLSKKNVLAQDLYSVEALSRVDTLCLDKTGTITDGTMVVERTIVLGQGDIEGRISSYLGAFKSNNQTSTALINKYGTESVFPVKNVVNFSSDKKYSAVEFEDDKLFILGAPEFITNDQALLDEISEYAENGLRAVLMAEVTSGRISEDTVIIKRLKNFAMFILRDNIRPEVPETMKWFRENDVDIKVISGDNAKTVSYIAKHAGIENWDKVVDMSTADPKDYEFLVMNNSVFARVSPEQKAEIVDILKKNKRTVAMTGDGINDIISLKKADCSIALSNGAQATKNISNLILLDSNFDNMKEAVFEGRRVVNNIQRSSSLFVMKDFLWMFIMIWPIIIGAPHILETTIMTLVNVFITGLGSVFLALEPDKTRIKGDFLKTVIGKGIISGFYMFLPVVCVYIYSFIHCGLDIQVVSNYILSNMLPVISICITIAGFVIFYNLCKPFTRYRRWLYCSIVALVICLLLLIPDFFLKNGTEFLKDIMEKYGSNFTEVVKGIWDSILNLSIYKSLGTSQWIIIGIFLALSSTLYIIIDKFISRLLNITMFNPDRFKEE